VNAVVVRSSLIPFLADLINNQIGLDASLNRVANEYGRSPIEDSLVNQIELELHTLQTAKQRVMDFIAEGVISKEEASQKLTDLRAKEERLKRKLVEAQEKGKIQAEFLEAVQSLQSVDLKTTLFEMLEVKPLILKRILQMIFKPNSVIVRSQRQGNTWRSELVSYEFSEGLKEFQAVFCSDWERNY
jgi:hypothetical protein